MSLIHIWGRTAQPTTSTGTGNINLDNSLVGRLTFAQANDRGGIVDGEPVGYTIEDGEAWEWGTITYHRGSPDVLGDGGPRTPTDSSDAGSPIDLSGDAIVWLDVPANRLPVRDTDGFAPGLPRKITVYSSSDTFTPDARTERLRVIVTGGGGGGGGADLPGSGNFNAGGGGGSGATGIKWLDRGDIGSTETVTIGAAGTAGNFSGGTAGGAGGTSSFGSHVSTPGGSGGSGIGTTANQAAPGGTGGAAGSGGDINIRGTPGGHGVATGDYSIGGNGAPSFWGDGARGTLATSTGASATAHGGGGAGGATTNPANRSGGAGAKGVVVVEEYW